MPKLPNMPQFQQMQYAFAAWIRKPDPKKTPQNIDRQRMDVYRSLFFRNVATFVENTFPVAREILGQERWQPLVEQFFEKHLSTSPYFREIPQEFMAWLLENPTVLETLPPWLAELLHYEWLEMHVATIDAPLPEVTTTTLELAKPVALSPFFMMAAYQWPVHTLSVQNQPSAQPAVPTLLAVYRTAEHKVRFMQLTPQAAMLLEVLQTDPTLTPLAAADQVSALIQQPFPADQVAALLTDLAARDIVLGQ